MDITEFFQQSVGKWFSQRTSHDITGNASLTGQSDLWVDELPMADPAVVSLCQQHDVDSNLVKIAVKVRWDGKLDGASQKQTGETILVVVAEGDRSGKLLRQHGPSATTESPSHYELGTDDALMLTTDTPTATTLERIWFESPSLRFRTSVIKNHDGTEFGSFCSEIRMGGAKPAG